jgi:hypothetical protein
MVVCLLGAKNRKVEVSLLTHMPPFSEDEKVKNFVEIGYCRNRVENLIPII